MLSSKFGWSDSCRFTSQTQSASMDAACIIRKQQHAYDRTFEDDFKNEKVTSSIEWAWRCDEMRWLADVIKCKDIDERFDWVILNKTSHVTSEQNCHSNYTYCSSTRPRIFHANVGVRLMNVKDIKYIGRPGVSKHLITPLLLNLTKWK